MDNIKKLKEIGLKKISVVTHIEERYLQYMVDSNFEKLNHINTHGFVKILSREYKLDLSAWAEAFEEYWQEHNIDNELKDKLFIFVEEEKTPKKLLKFTLFAIFVALLALVFSLFKDELNFENFENKNTSNYEQTENILDAKKLLDEINESNTSNGIEDLQEKEIFINDGNNSGEFLEKKITSDAIKIQEAISTDEGTQEKSIAIVDTLTVDKTEKKNIKFENTAIIVPKSSLWLGVIDLDDKKRQSFLGEGNVSIDLSKNQIVTTGHGSFSIVSKNLNKEFSVQTPVRLLIKDGNITQISGDTFKELNEGKTW